MKYYAVERSDEYLAHYGIKGMKWGVRKAISSIRSSYSYMKAKRKLSQLTSEQRGLKKKASKALSKMNDAQDAKRESKLGKFGLGKEARKYRRAKWKFARATSRYYNSLNSDQYKKLRNRIIRAS